MLLLQEISLKQGTAFTIFTEAELIDATDKFDNRNILGRGGHGTVYKGMVKEGIRQRDVNPFPDQPQEHCYTGLLPRSRGSNASL